MSAENDAGDMFDQGNGEQPDLPDVEGFAESVARDLAASANMQSALPSDFADMVDFDDEDWDEWADAPDPGCQHPWYRLDFVTDDLGLGCSRCGQAWLLDDDGDAQEALLVVWQAARMELEQSATRYGAMAAVVEQVSGKRHCRACDVWGEASDFIDIAGVRACAHHLGADLAQMDDYEGRLGEVVSWMVDAGWVASLDPLEQWTLETNILMFPPIGESLGRVDANLPAVNIVLSEPVATALGVPLASTVGTATAALAALLGLDEPSARPSHVFLLGVIAQADARQRGVLERELQESVARATPVHGTQRAIIVMDLCRSDMPEEGSFTGDMADDLVHSVGVRAAEVFL